MKATHLVTDTERDVVYEFSVSGDNYYWRRLPGGDWRGPCAGWFDNTYSENEWVTKKLNTFKGNK